MLRDFFICHHWWLGFPSYHLNLGFLPSVNSIKRCVKRSDPLLIVLCLLHKRKSSFWTNWVSLGPSGLGITLENHGTNDWRSWRNLKKGTGYVAMDFVQVGAWFVCLSWCVNIRRYSSHFSVSRNYYCFLSLALHGTFSLCRVSGARHLGWNSTYSVSPL
jgi:hypothetical protein